MELPLNNITVTIVTTTLVALRGRLGLLSICLLAYGVEGIL